VKLFEIIIEKNLAELVKGNWLLWTKPNYKCIYWLAGRVWPAEERRLPDTNYWRNPF
jgi:hypothetical protein